jgi:hypothetical protein
VSQEATVTSPAKGPWWRGRAFLGGVAVAAVLTAIVVSDLATESTGKSNLATSQGIMSEIQTDVAPCSFGMNESLELYRDATSGHISAADRKQIPNLLSDDFNSCSFTNATIVDLSSIDLSHSQVGEALNRVAYRSLLWCEPAAFDTIDHIANLVEGHDTASGRSKLAHDEIRLNQDRAAVRSSVAQLERVLRSTNLPHLKLVVAP